MQYSNAHKIVRDVHFTQQMKSVQWSHAESGVLLLFVNCFSFMFCCEPLPYAPTLLRSKVSSLRRSHRCTMIGHCISKRSLRWSTVLMDQEIAAMYVLGSTGEGASLTFDERCAVAESFVLRPMADCPSSSRSAARV